MKKIVKIFCLGILISLYGCGFGEWDITLYEQKIEGTSMAIYKYDAWGGRDSHVSGYAVLDTTQNFTIQRIRKLPIRQLAEIPNKNLIRAIGSHKSKDEANFTPEGVDKLQSEGLNIEIKNYHSSTLRVINQGLQEYEFSKFQETRDSIFFYDLDEIRSKDKSHIDSLRIKKGNVIIRQNEDKEILRIVIEHLVLSNDGKDSLISNRTYYLKPKKTTKSSLFSDYGIFKEKSIVSKRAL